MCDSQWLLSFVSELALFWGNICNTWRFNILFQYKKCYMKLPKLIRPNSFENEVLLLM